MKDRKHVTRLVLALVAALLFVVPLDSASAASTLIHVKPATLTNTGHGCNTGEWHFLINQVGGSVTAPSSIQVWWANGQTAMVPLHQVTGGTAHYRTTLNLNSPVTDAVATIDSSWTGQFNLSHGPCFTQPTPTKTPVPPTATKTPVPPTVTPTPTRTPIAEETQSKTPTPTKTPVAEETQTKTPTPTKTPVAEETQTKTPTPTKTPVAEETQTKTPTPTATSTPTDPGVPQGPVPPVYGPPSFVPVPIIVSGSSSIHSSTPPSSTPPTVSEVARVAELRSIQPTPVRTTPVPAAEAEPVVALPAAETEPEAVMPAETQEEPAPVGVVVPRPLEQVARLPRTGAGPAAGLPAPSDSTRFGYPAGVSAGAVLSE